MAKKQAAVPDAWDDDWEAQADKDEEPGGVPIDPQEVKLSKAERLAKHAELNKQIWESAETPEPFHFLAATDNVPLKTEFKPALKVLSRRPAPKVVARQDPVTGLSQMTIDDEDDDEEQNQNKPTPEELRAKTQREREEKQRKYEEVRARLFGKSDTGSGTSSPGNVTPPGLDENRSHRDRGKGRGRGGGGRGQDTRRTDNQHGARELFDPNSPKQGSVTIQRRSGEAESSGRSTPRDEDQLIRAPRGPSANGRGGFAFANRGGTAG